ncbi:MAG: glycosyltransferase family 4 protein [Ferrimicrobium sp.]
MKITFVTPRYGSTIIGGAESAVRSFAERLAQRDHNITVISSTAQDLDWRAKLPAGTSVEAGVTVIRLNARTPRPDDFSQRYRRTLATARTRSTQEAEAFLVDQGPVLPELPDLIAGLEADRIVSYPYLYWPTLIATRVGGARSVLHPAAHPEPALRLPIYRELFEHVPRIVVQTRAEHDLLVENFRLSATKIATIGLGVSPPETIEGPSGQSILGIAQDRPYLLSLGRIEPEKGSRFLATLAQDEVGIPLIALVGPTTDPPAGTPRLLVHPQVDDRSRWRLLADATAVVVPSRFEAFSLVTLEAMAMGTPVVVNGLSPATAQHVLASGAGFAASTPRAFLAACRLIADNPSLRDRLGQCGVDYWRANFTWERILECYERFLTPGGGSTPQRTTTPR